MSIIIEGYNYDIFISYRQKYNKYDGGVTEFVDHLKALLNKLLKRNAAFTSGSQRSAAWQDSDIPVPLSYKPHCTDLFVVLSGK